MDVATVVFPEALPPVIPIKKGEQTCPISKVYASNFVLVENFKKL
jgi:hypothetical protein